MLFSIYATALEKKVISFPSCNFCDEELFFFFIIKA
ncbi:hypothetical protein NEOC65_000513 [Neochlamydia sp. AcF65]|nr:hypothetical protein [Neochlamydia sp. AcF65]MBS4169422.1 hypothetical protein [Neochlamydia sp. AcF95]